MKMFSARLRLAFLRALPKIALSRCAGRLAGIRFPRYFLQFFIRIFVRRYKINMAESASHSFATFNEFFTRPLRPECRRIDPRERAIISPVDGVVGGWGKIAANTLVQAKGIDYGLGDLVIHRPYADIFQGGHYLTLYLSPRHYHRIHAPVAGRIAESYYIPGTLYPVNPFAVEHIPGLFTLNERLITLIQSHSAGQVAVIMVGATVVGQIRVVYDRVSRRKASAHKKYAGLSTERGAELGRFLMGSTVILLFEAGRIDFLEGITAGVEVKWGEAVAEIADRP